MKFLKKLFKIKALIQLSSTRWLLLELIVDLSIVTKLPHA